MGALLNERKFNPLARGEGPLAGAERPQMGISSNPCKRQAAHAVLKQRDIGVCRVAGDQQLVAVKKSVSAGRKQRLHRVTHLLAVMKQAHRAAW
jgi:hypothetical protein